MKVDHSSRRYRSNVRINSYLGRNKTAMRTKMPIITIRPQQIHLDYTKKTVAVLKVCQAFETYSICKVPYKHVYKRVNFISLYFPLCSPHTITSMLTLVNLLP